MIEKQVNIALQVLPVSKDIHPYILVDKAIEVIAASGLNYKVTPFETVIEGTYDQITQETAPPNLSKHRRLHIATKLLLFPKMARNLQTVSARLTP